MIKVPIMPERYEIEIKDLKDKYIFGEKYEFSVILRGFGFPCGAIHITYPINETSSTTIGSIPGCTNTMPMEFVLDKYNEYGKSYGHIALNPGNYTIQVQFEHGVNGPTIAEKSFIVVEP